MHPHGTRSTAGDGAVVALLASLALATVSTAFLLVTPHVLQLLHVSSMHGLAPL